MQNSDTLINFHQKTTRKYVDMGFKCNTYCGCPRPDYTFVLPKTAVKCRRISRLSLHSTYRFYISCFAKTTIFLKNR